MCRGFWIKFCSEDFDKLENLEFLLNGHKSCKMDKDQLILTTLIKSVCGYQIIFINLQLGLMELDLSKNFDKCKEIYSSSLNLSRIDNFKISFNFSSDFLSSNPITVSSVYSNILGMEISNLNLVNYEKYY
jgi:hypothetical protein